MPRKINEKGSRPIKNKSGIVTHQEETVLKTIKPVEPVAEDYYKCCTCGKKYTKQSGNFSYSQSPLYKGNNSFLPICNHCLENLVEQYTEILGSQNEAIKRICLHWDMYFNETILNSTKKIDANRSRIKNYVRNCNLNQNNGKTYDTYLQEMNKGIIQNVDQIDEMKAEGQTNITKVMFDVGDKYQVRILLLSKNIIKCLKNKTPIVIIIKKYLSKIYVTLNYFSLKHLKMAIVLILKNIQNFIVIHLNRQD